MKWLPYIIFLGFIVVFGYWILEYPTIVDILKLVIAGISAGLTIQAIQTYKEIKEKYLIHSKVLLDNNLKFRTKTDIFFKHDNTLDLQIKNSYPFSTIEDKSLSLPISDRRYSNEVDAHLKSGYLKEVWENGTSRDRLIHEHNAMARDFLNKVVKRIISEIREKNPSLIEWDKPNPPIKYFQPKYISNSTYNVIQGFYEHTFDLDKTYNVRLDNKWILCTDYTLAASDNENEMQEVKQIIIDVLNGVLSDEDFRELRRNRENIKEKHNLYVNGIDKRIMEVENGIPLKGHCRFCPKPPFF